MGVALRVITWPMGFIVVAHARRRIFLAVEVAYAVVFMAVAWAGIRWVGLNGSGMAFFVSYVFHGVMLYPVVRKLSGFRWSPANRRLMAHFLTSILLTFASQYVLPPWIVMALGTIVVAGACLYSARSLVRLVSTERLPLPVRRIAGWLAS
jgi:PST family polysaccharide transporter